MVCSELIDRLGVYIHYPYCRRRCSYCDFAIAVKPVSRIDHQAYLDAIRKELVIRGPVFIGPRLVSIYFGGGTPSLWPAEYLGQAVALVRNFFGPKQAGGESSLEITIEANPTDCTPHNLDAWAECGINRLSIGVQSTDDGELVTLGRDHRMGDGLTALEAAINDGRFRISADIILGTPNSASGGMETLTAVTQQSASNSGRRPGHLSVYELTFETGAPLGRAAQRGELSPRDDDELAEIYERTDAELSARGYEHYEISSYARPGERAIHNSLYWQGASYLGLGASAASFLPDGSGAAIRETNVRSAARYLLTSGQETVAVREVISAAQVRADNIWLGLRTREGIALAVVSERPKFVAWLTEHQLATISNGRIQPTLKGFLYANQVAAHISS